MYDELIKALRNMSKMGTKYGMAVIKMREAADAIEELQKAVNFHKFNSEFWEDKYNSLADEKWIPVTERLPKEADGMVFVLMPDVFPYNLKQPFVNCNQDRRIEMAHYSEHSKTWYFGDCGAVGGKEPIAWIHRNALPQPPKEE